MNSEHSHHIISYKTYTIIWLLLLLFTGLSVAARYIDFHAFAVTVALVIATIKGTVVSLYFMHLKFESKFLKTAVFISYIVFVSLILFTFLDYSLR